MEQQLTNNEIAKVFAMYMPCECETIYGIMTLNGLQVGSIYPLWFYRGNSVNEDTPELMNNRLSGKGAKYSEVKLILTPLTKITDEHAIELAKMKCGRKEIIHFYSKRELIELAKEEWIESSTVNLYGQPNQFQYLIQQGYAVPLFFGVNHWANGKTAIELGIAIEKQPLTSTEADLLTQQLS